MRKSAILVGDAYVRSVAVSREGLTMERGGPDAALMLPAGQAYGLADALRQAYPDERWAIRVGQVRRTLEVP